MNPEYIAPEWLQHINAATPYVTAATAGWMGSNLWYNTRKERSKVYDKLQSGLEAIVRG